MSSDEGYSDGGEGGGKWGGVKMLNLEKKNLGPGPNPTGQRT